MASSSPPAKNSNGACRQPDVSTPFNKRLISSTPDPERLLEIAREEEATVLAVGATASQAQTQKETQSQGHMPTVKTDPLLPFPQMVPERDTGHVVDDNKKMTLGGIEELLQKQRQNQLVWQQQLVQLQSQFSANPSTNPSTSQDDEDGSKAGGRSAFYRWLGMKSSAPIVESQFMPVSVVDASETHPNPTDKESSLYPKAVWVEEDVEQAQSASSHHPPAATIIHPNSEVNHNTIKSSADLDEKVQEKNKLNNDGPSYSTFGVSSSSFGRMKKTLTWLETTQNEADEKLEGGKNGSSQGNRLPKMLSEKSEANYVYDKFASSKPPIATNANANSKIQIIDKSKPQPPSFVPKPVVMPKSSTTKVSTRNGVNVARDAKWKKRKEKSPIVDERGVDIPPIETPANRAQVSNVEFVMPNLNSKDSTIAKSLEFDTKVIGQRPSNDLNVSASTCSEEVGNFLSQETADEETVVVTSKSASMVYTQNTALQSKSFSQESDKSLKSFDTSAILKVLQEDVQAKSESDTSAANKGTHTTIVDDKSKISPTSEDQNSVESIISKPESAPGETTDSNTSAVKEKGSVLSSPPQQSVTCETTICENLKEDNVEAERLIEEAHENVNQNYHEDELWDHGSPFNLHYLDKMADPTLHKIACRLALKATALRDGELRSLIDSMIYHTDAALAHEDSRYQSSQMIFVDENNKLKKRIHTINRQLEVKERLERQADVGFSNADVMHLERKNLYLRQEKDRLDQQVTNLLEEKSKWLTTQQDLVKTVSMKDHEILKLEEKHQEEKKSLHQALDQATKNSQGVHFKLAVADREIANVEQRVKAKDHEMMELKDRIQLLEQELDKSMDVSRNKDAEVKRLQNLVETLKVGVDDVLKAYEASTQGREETKEQRQGISFLRQIARDTDDKPQHYFSREFPAQSRPRSQHVPPEGSHHQSSGTIQHAKEKEDGGEGVDRHRFGNNFRRTSQAPRARPGLPMRSDELFDSSLLRRGKGQEHHSGFSTNEGSSLTLRAVEEHNRRYTPIDKTLWHSLDTQHVMPVISGEEPYYSDSEIHYINARERRRRGCRQSDSTNLDFVHQNRRSSSVSPYRHKESGRRISHEYFDDSGQIHSRSILNGSGLGDERKLSRSRGQIERPSRKQQDVFTSTKRHGGPHHGIEKIISSELSLTSIPLDVDLSLDGDGTLRQHSTQDNTIHLSDRNWADRQLATRPANSRQQRSRFEEADERRRTSSPIHGSKYPPGRDNNRQIRNQPSHRQFPTSLKSIPIVDLSPPSGNESRFEPESVEVDTQHPSTRMYTLTADGVNFQSLDNDGQPQLRSSSNPLSASYPLYSKQKTQSRSTHHSVDDQYSSLISASLPVSSTERNQYPRSHQYNRHTAESDSYLYPTHTSLQNLSLVPSTDQGENYQPTRSGVRRQKMLYQGHVPGQLAGKRTVTFNDDSTESMKTPSASFQSDFLTYGESIPFRNSHLNTSDISVSRRATKDTNSFQRDFFQGTELSGSLSSISERDMHPDTFDNNNNNQVLGEESFETGIASLDSKIARLQEKINHTKAVFS